jgi:folylpolyglutamate synthase/dihydropteroate synthase
MLESLLPKVDTLYITRFSNAHRPCVNPKEIIDFSKNLIPEDKIFFFSDQIQAFNTAKENLKENDILLVTGSFYLAGDIRKLYCSEEKILEQRNSNIVL